MNNEQEMILREKIEKREKFDTILAYVLIGILVICIVVVIVLKVNDKEDEVVQEEYTPNYISIEDISTSLNGSDLVKGFIEEGVRFSSSVSGNSIVVDYANEDNVVNINIPMVGNELMISINEENSIIANDIYKEIGSIICVYYGNVEKYCKNTLDNMEDNGNDSIRIINNGDITSVYIDTTKSYTVNSEIVYNDVTKVNVNDNDYVLNIDNYKIHDISVVSGDTSIKFSGSIDRTGDDNSNIGLLVKLYDIDGNVIGENKYEYNDTNVLEDTSTFEVEFLFDDTLKLENINKYSIEIVK